MLAELRAYGRFAAGLPRFLRKRLTLEQARAEVGARLRSRESAFLDLVRRGIVGNRHSPYRRLLELADCEYGDVERSVGRDGLERCLELLREAGVYITFEELKGRRPIVRQGVEVPVVRHGFDNPLVKRYVRGRTSGSTGRPTRTSVDLAHLRATASQVMVARAAHHTLGVPTCHWRSILPSTAGINSVLRSALMGSEGDVWLTPITPDHVRASIKDRMATRYILLAGRLSGAGLPDPRPVELERADEVARWAAEAARGHGRCVLRGHVSTMLRVALAAEQLALDLTGVVFMGGGEPPTEAKVRVMTGTGADFVPTYFFAEAGAVGFGCAAPVHFDEVHLLSDGLALVTTPVEGGAPRDGARTLYFTALLPSAPKMLLNVASDDVAVVEPRSCGCPLETAGYTTHLRRIRSVAKMTVEGVTLVEGDMLRILEEELPSRFGGTPHDFQVAEVEDDTGRTRLHLRVHPRLDIEDESRVLATVFEVLGRGDASAELSRAVWEQSGVLSVRREPPQWNHQGKFPSVLTLGGGSASGPAGGEGVDG